MTEIYTWSQPTPSPMSNFELRQLIFSWRYIPKMFLFCPKRVEEPFLLPIARRSSQNTAVICCLPDRQHPQVVRGISIYKGKNSLSQLYFKRRAPPPTAPAMRPNSRNHTEGSASPPSDTPPDVCTTLLVQYQGWCRRRKGCTGPSVTRMEKSGPCHLMTFFKKERKNSTRNINTGLDQLLRLRLRLPVLSRSLFSAPLCNCLGAWKAWSCRQ